MDTTISPLEKLPHLLDKVLQYWGTAKLNSFVEELLMDSRDGRRQGLPVDVSQDLMMLAEVNTLARAMLAARLQNIPFPDALRKIEGDLILARTAGMPADPMASQELAHVDREERRARLAAKRPVEERAPGRKKTEERVGLFDLLTHRYVLIVLIAILLYYLAKSQLF